MMYKFVFYELQITPLDEHNGISIYQIKMHKKNEIFDDVQLISI